MSQNTTFNVRLDSELKDNVEEVLNKLGLSLADAIRMYFVRIEMEQGIPFELKIPNLKTRKVIAASHNPRKRKSFNSVDELFTDLNR